MYIIFIYIMYIYIYINVYTIFVCFFYFFLNVKVYYKWNNITLKLLKRVSVIFGLFQNLLQTSSNKTPSMCIYIIYIVHSEDISVIYIYIFNWYIYIYTYLIDGANLLIKKTKHQENSITLVLNFPQHWI